MASTRDYRSLLAKSCPLTQVKANHDVHRLASGLKPFSRAKHCIRVDRSSTVEIIGGKLATIATIDYQA